MVDYVNFFVVNLILDFSTGLLSKKIFKLSIKKIEILFLQIFNIAAMVIYLFCGIEFYQYLLLKTVSNFIICLLITDSYSFKNLLKLMLFYIMLMFSIFGFYKFIMLLINSLFSTYLNKKIAKNFNFIVIFIIFLYFYAISWITYKISKEKYLKKFLSKVSFTLYGKHIEVIGLFDSGNSLIDKKTNLPVIVINAKFLKKYFKNINYDYITSANFCNRTILCECVGGVELQMPIVDIQNVCIYSDEQIKKIDCVLGIINQKFYDEKKYDCLLHRDFI